VDTLISKTEDALLHTAYTSKSKYYNKQSSPLRCTHSTLHSSRVPFNFKKRHLGRAYSVKRKIKEGH
jgi:hypothetical protein